MRILHITDLHIGFEGEDTYGVDVRSNFLNLLQRIKEIPSDHLVINGDLCYRDGQTEIYHWIKEKLSDYPTPISVISGNHDDPVLLAETFDCTHQIHDKELYFQKEIGSWNAFFLDTTHATVSEPQMSWLKEGMGKTAAPICIFMHHPPTCAGVPFMDNNHKLENMREVMSLFHAHLHPVYVFVGHYHVEKTIHIGNVTVSITPSNFFQMDQYQETFGVDH
ncbi:MAG: metallophosphoesterase, partial [Bacteroidota bacterium]